MNSSEEAHFENVNEAYLRSIYEEGSPEWDLVHFDDEYGYDEYSRKHNTYYDDGYDVDYDSDGPAIDPSPYDYYEAANAVELIR